METITENQKLSLAMFSESFPCNPLPFLNGLAEGCKVNGSDYLQTDECKRIQFCLIGMSYGQSFRIDSLSEFQRLKNTK